MTARGQTSTVTLRGAETLAENPSYSYYKLSEEPDAFKAMTVSGGKVSFGNVVGSINETTGADGAVTYMARHANIEIKTSGIEVDPKNVSAVVVTADSAPMPCTTW